MSQCFDCEDKAKRKNQQLDIWRGQYYAQPMAVCLGDDGLQLITLEVALMSGAAIKEVLMK